MSADVVCHCDHLDRVAMIVGGIWLYTKAGRPD
jgi:hypothetical protein